MAITRISGFTTKKDSTVTSSPWSGIAIDVTAAAETQVILIVSTDGVSGDTDDADNSRHTSITDTKGNVWAKLKEWEVVKFGTRNAIVSVWCGKITTQLTAGTDTLTFSWSGTLDDNVNKIICSEKFTGAANGFTVADAQTEVEDIADYDSETISGLSNTERLFVRAWASEGGNNSGIVSTNYTLFTNAFTAATLLASGVDSTSMKGGGEYRILTGTGDTSDPTASVPGGRSVSVYLALTPASIAAVTTRGLVPSRRSAPSVPPN